MFIDNSFLVSLDTFILLLCSELLVLIFSHLQLILYLQRLLTRELLVLIS